jgi:formate dehydrogenase subunit gamma
VLLITGWWLLTGHEGRPSFVARIVHESDVDLHRRVGWGLAITAALAITVGIRGAASFVRETLRINRGDGWWFIRWPVGAFTGRFAHHRGHFDPGQRIANLAFVVTLGTLIGTGISLTTMHGGPTFVWVDRIHRYATYSLTALVAMHLLIAIGILPGYRGVWRSMHVGGRTPASTIRRVWPESIASRSESTSHTEADLASESADVPRAAMCGVTRRSST